MRARGIVKLDGLWMFTERRLHVEGLKERALS